MIDYQVHKNSFLSHPHFIPDTKTLSGFTLFKNYSVAPSAEIDKIQICVQLESAAIG
ncbi:MAG: hypothetical protein J6Y11_09855 [Paludibacteraceae bacterium]|nr:hypothetical protein [Paludibacteraceae bacterium]